MLPVAVMAQNKGNKLTVERVKNDLVGHRLSEGVANGYHEEGWTFTIRKGCISNFKVTKVLEKTANRYTFVAQMHLSERHYGYNAKCKISYRRQSGQTWKLDYVRSMGMHIVATHDYDDCIRASVVDDGWGGTYCLKLTNTSEMTLVVGGDILTMDGWRRYSCAVEPHKSATVGGVMNGGSVQRYRIAFVVRKY